MADKNDFDDTTKFLLDQINIHNAQVHSEMVELEKQRFTWIFQLVTIASAILGGFMLTKADRNILEDIALGVLFAFIFLALLFVYLYNKQVREETARDSLYHQLSLFASFRVHELSKKDELTKKEEDEIKRCENYQKKANELLKKKMSEVSEEITKILKGKEKHSDKYINISYVLLIGIGLAILLLIYADYLI